MSSRVLNLKFDTMTINTTLAQAYFEKNSNFFKSIADTEKDYDDFGLDPKKNKICYFIAKPISKNYNIDQIKDRTSILNKIEKEIFNNSALISQIEHAIRGVSIEDSLKYDLKLICQQFNYYGNLLDKEDNNIYYGDDGVPVVLDKSTPLAKLGIVAKILFARRNVIIYCDPHTAVIGHLFTEICLGAGLTKQDICCIFLDVNSINNSFTEDPSHLKYCYLIEDPNKDSVDGTVAVVTDMCDIDSAIVSIASATTNPIYPWKISRVIIQESIANEFIQSLKNKSELENSSKKTELMLENKSREVICYKNKYFLIDFVDKNTDTEGHVIVESYRTTKELLSLLKRYGPAYMSLWCCDSSVTNEIVFGFDATTVWVNNFGVFDNTEVSHNYFASLRVNMKKVKNSSQEFTKIIADIAKENEKWMELDLSERRQILLGIADKYKDILKKDIYEDVINKITKYDKKSLVNVGKGTLCIGVKEPVGVVIGHSFQLNFIFLLNSILLGNSVIVQNNADIFQDLKSKGAPVRCVDIIPYLDQISLLYAVDVPFKWRIITSQFGETFAN